MLKYIPEVHHMVRTGLDRIAEMKSLFAGKRIALATGASGLNSKLISSVDCFMDTYGLSMLLSPEHGVRGEKQAGDEVGDFIDERTGVRCVSLFGGGFHGEGGLSAAESAAAQVDIVAFDMQDAGSRYYTYASTLFYIMHACAKTGTPVAVLDRPNPLGGIRLEGNTHRDENLSFIGRTHVPIRHGMTMGELARFFNGEYHIGCDLHVVAMDGWKRDMWYDDTGLPFTPPSPNLPTLDSMAVYNGTCLFEGTNVTVGRGTTEPFTLIGAPYIDGGRLAKRLNELGLPGLRFAEAYFTPWYAKYAGEVCGGVRIYVEERKKVDGVRTGVTMMRAVQDMFPQFAFRAPNADGRWHIDIASGTDELRRGVKSAEEICEGWRKEAEAFRKTQQMYSIY